MAPTPGPIPGTVGPIIQDDSGYLTTHRKSTTVSTKGLLNMPGQNNCFLNSAVQVLWHLDSFRRNFRELSGHSCMAESCIFCALKELFTQFQYSQESALPPDALRHALAKTFCDQRRFQLGFMDDAAECFENILLQIHVHIANQEVDDMCGNLNCIPHQKFAMTLVEQRVCQTCSAASEPLPFTQMVHYVTTSALCAKAIDLLEDPNYRQISSFGKLLRLAGEMGEARECPSGCGGKVQIRKTLMNHPEVVSIGLVWDSESPTLQHITDVFHTIGMYLRLQEMFHNVYDGEWASYTTHQLVGVVTYYGKHYSTFFFHTKLRVWIYFDDATVREVGPSWEQVVEKCQRGRFQPLLLLFASPDSSFSSLKRDNSSNIYSNLPCDSLNKSPVMNQRQAVINQYMKFQNCQVGSYSKPTYGLTICAKASEFKPNQTYEQQLYNNQKTAEQGLVTNNTGSGINPMVYNYDRSIQNQNLPVYSNLQYLNSLQHKPDTIEASKLNPSFSPMNAQTMNSHQDLPLYNHHDIACKDQDFDAAKDSDSAFTEEDAETHDMYISRKAVESVLSLQKKQMTLCRSYSQSAIGNRNSSSSLESFDNAQTNKPPLIKTSPVENPPIRRDSGSWSSDRNSSSSNTSVENPFLTMVTSKRLLLGLNKKPLVQDTNSSDHGYDSFSVSSSDSYPSVNGSPVKVEPRLTQIPEDWLPEEDHDLDKKLKLITEDDSGPPDCDKLCAEADLLLAKSHEKEKDGDLVMAALLSDSAAARARAAMEAPYNNSKSLVSAKMKHSTCVMRSSNLYRRLKDHEIDERRKQKSHNGHHSRQSSRDSTHSKHSRQSSKDSSHSKGGNKENHTSDEGDHFGKSIEIYGTLPKKGSRKKANTTSGSTKVKDDQVYKDFLDKQRKNTSLSEALNETLLKNVDQPKTRIDCSPKRKSHSNSERKSLEVVSPKSPTRKKEGQSKSESDTKKRTPKTSPIPTAIQTNNRNSTPEFNRDLLSPIPSPEKKPHKIKRKLMGGFMKRKNRSLPDLREDQTSNDPMDCFLDDAIIEVPSNSTNGRPKVQLSDTKTAKITRGFHPHHGFAKKDLTQRPLLMKVSPPNVQLSALPNPKTKLVQTLPSIPKKPIENKLESSYTNSVKPSKIPFMSSSPKIESNLPPLPSYKPVDANCIKPVISPKISAIPVLSPQIPLSPIRPSNNSKENVVVPSTHFDQPPCEQVNDLDIPQPTNPFLAEIQAKRKQVLHKSLEKNIPDQPAPQISKGELSMLPKLAIHGEGTSWLKELQNKQQQILSKQDPGKVSKPNLVPDKEPKPQIPVRVPEYTKNEPNKPSQKNWKLLPENVSEVDGVSSPVSNATSNSVKNLASRFEKVLQPKPVSSPVSPILSPEKVEAAVIPMKNESIKDHTNIPVSTKNFNQETPSLAIPRSVPLKSALKTRIDANCSTGKEMINQSPPAVEAKPVKSALKATTMSNPTDLHTLGIPNVENSMLPRPMQPPDYATALQRIGMIRTSASDAGFPAPPPELLDTIEPPKKKQGPKKTVTFSDKVVLVACAEYDEIDFSSNPLFERVYQQHVESGKGEIPILSNTYGNSYSADNGRSDEYEDNSNNEANNSFTSCNLCHTKPVTPPKTYCIDCEFYLSRFKPSN